MNLFRYKKGNNAPVPKTIVKVDKEIQSKAHVNQFTGKTNDEMMAEVVADFHQCSAMFEKVMKQFMECELKQNITETDDEIKRELEDT